MQKLCSHRTARMRRVRSPRASFSSSRVFQTSSCAPLGTCPDPTVPLGQKQMELSGAHLLAHAHAHAHTHTHTRRKLPASFCRRSQFFFSLRARNFCSLGRFFLTDFWQVVLCSFLLFPARPVKRVPWPKMAFFGL